SDAVPLANGFTAIDTTSPPCTAGQDGPAIPTEWTIPFTYTFAADGSVTMEGEVVCEPGVEPTIFHSEGSGTWVPSTGSFALSMLVTFGGDSSSLDVTGTVDPEAGTITLDGETSAVRIIPIDD
ncbi:MAG: hypothetical protein GY724_24305, partial [Actinomycetia bacterium]|nr:hypothetical protein [Actinomycetes bacterium]